MTLATDRIWLALWISLVLWLVQLNLRPALHLLPVDQQAHLGQLIQRGVILPLWLTVSLCVVWINHRTLRYHQRLGLNLLNWILALIWLIVLLKQSGLYALFTDATAAITVRNLMAALDQVRCYPVPSLLVSLLIMQARR